MDKVFLSAIIGVAFGAFLMEFLYLRKIRNLRADQRIGSRLALLGSPSFREAICAHIRSDLSLHGDGLAVIGSKKDAALVKWILENEYVPQKDIERAVHEGICQIGRNMFDWCMAGPSPHHPDQVLSIEALGYAMRHGTISSEEMKTLNFDRGETSEEYMKHAEGLLEKVMCQLRDGTAFFNLFAFEGSG